MEDKIEIFISHSHQDVDIVEAIVTLLLNAINISKKKIRCSSLKGFRLDAGAHIDEQIKKEINNSIIFLAVITSISMESSYVPFELGARWGMNKFLVPILLTSKDADLLKGPMAQLNSLFCDDKFQIQEFLEKVSKRIEGSLASQGNYESQIELLCELSTKPRTKSREIILKGELSKLYRGLPAILSAPESTHIQTIANEKTTPYLMHRSLRSELGRLSHAGLIEPIIEKSVSDLPDGSYFRLKDYYNITVLGRHYLQFSGEEIN